MLADGQGSCAEAELIRCVRSDAVAVIGDIVMTVEPLRGPTAALGILHSKAMDWAVQKAVEIGVETFIPVLCERSQGSLSHAEGRLEHWRRVALQALKQCRRAWAMRVESP
jgi:RsmE family RNA methyltransferase